MKVYNEKFSRKCCLDVNCGNMTCQECDRIKQKVWREALEWGRKQLWGRTSLEVIALINREIRE